MNIRVPDVSAQQRAERSNRRAQWMKQVRQWHWISGALCLIVTLMFALTGFTLNHAADIEAKAAVTTKEATLAPAIVAELAAAPKTGRAPVPQSLSAWASKEFGIAIDAKDAEWSDSEVYVSLPRPGGDAWLSIDRETGAARYELTSRGWIAYLNDLHKGRNTGPAWSWFIDIFAAACVVFCITGLLLLQLYAKSRPSTWPVVGFGLALPLLLAIFLIH